MYFKRTQFTWILIIIKDAIHPTILWLSRTRRLLIYLLLFPLINSNMFQNIWAAKQLNERTMVSARRRRHFYEHWSAFMCFSADSGHLRLKDISIHIRCHSICILIYFGIVALMQTFLLIQLSHSVFITHTRCQNMENTEMCRLLSIIFLGSFRSAINYVSKQPEKHVWHAYWKCTQIQQDIVLFVFVFFSFFLLGYCMWQTMNGVLQNLAQSQSTVTCW